jgi:hypothetical protein
MQIQTNIGAMINARNAAILAHEMEAAFKERYRAMKDLQAK